MVGGGFDLSCFGWVDYCVGDCHYLIESSEQPIYVPDRLELLDKLEE